MPNYKDKTLLDNNRTLLNFQRPEIQNVLPEYFGENFPNLLSLFEAYYEWMEDSSNPTGQIERLYRNRDATQVPSDLLPFLEDELLLGQSYFGGFTNKREAIKFSNLLYRSKGTKYAVEQFFRGFFNKDPQVVYPKENIFNVGPEIDYELDSINTSGQQIKKEAGKLGPESRKFLTDDKLYQAYSILIKSDVPISKWLDTYKLFVHPAGAYLAGELVLELVNGNVVQSVRESGAGIPVESTVVAERVALAHFGVPNEDITLIERGDGTIGRIRSKARENFGAIGTAAFDSAPTLTMRELQTPTSFLMDDSDTASLIRFDQDSTGLNILTLSTMDDARYRTLFDSSANLADSVNYPL